MTQPINNLEHGSLLAVETQGFVVRLVIGQVADVGCAVRMEQDVARQLRDALTAALGEDVALEDVIDDYIPETAMTYRNWVYWVTQTDAYYYPRVVPPDMKRHAVRSLSGCVSHQVACETAIAHIDKQYMPVDDGPPVIG